MAGKTRTTTPIECKICKKMCKDSASRSRHLNTEHGIKTDEQKLNYLLKYDTENNYYCETGDGSLKEFKRAILSELPFEEKCYKLSKDKYQFIKKLSGRFDKFRKLADYIFLDLGLTKKEITKDIINTHKKQFTPTTIEFFLNKTNGDLEKAKKLLFERQSIPQESPLNRLINKYGEDEGLRKWDLRNKKCSLSLDGFILRHGESKGIELYKKYIDESNSFGTQSKIAVTLFNQLLLECEYPENVFMATTDNGEFNIHLTDEEKTILNAHNFYLDFTYNNKVIEFNGDYWHKNPKIYEPTKNNKAIWEREEKRTEIIKNRGFDILIVWEQDFRNNASKIINECIKFLKE